MYKFVCLFLCIFSLGWSYEVEFIGINDQEIYDQLCSISTLIKKKNHPPKTTAALRRRAEKDVANFLKVMHSFAYLEAKVTFDVSKDQVFVFIESGPIYPFSECKVEGIEVCLEDLGLIPGDPALPKTILDAEEIILKSLRADGYPLAKIVKRDVIVDLNAKCASLYIQVECGPLCFFGETFVVGNEKVKERFFLKKIFWSYGELYDEKKVIETEKEIETSSLFSSLSVAPKEALDDHGLLPMVITVEENAHRSVGIGLAYATILGPGLALEWENRNMRGVGEKLSFQANLWWKFQQGKILYVKPDYLKKRQDLILQAEVEHEKTKGFQERSATLSASLERRINKRLRLSYGVQVKELETSDSDNNRSYTLFRLPVQIRYSHADSLLDPTLGVAFHLKFTPAVQTLHPRFAYLTNWLTASFYRPIKQELIFATKLTCGSILGASRFNIPPSERFYAGSDTCLRGYHYLTVSPLNDDKCNPKPIGGRSILALSLEARLRKEESLGWVLFYDVGNVWASFLPNLREKILQSVGIGARYPTPVGPLRADLAFPLNPRRHLDSICQFYISIGQAF